MLPAALYHLPNRVLLNYITFVGGLLICIFPVIHRATHAILPPMEVIVHQSGKLTKPQKKLEADYG